MQVINFKKEDPVYGCFSNFHPAVVEFEGVKYCSAECAFQAAKTLDLNDRPRFAKMNPGYAKRLGRKLSLRPDWENVKRNIMYELVKSKAHNNPEFCKTLLSTKGCLLVEDTTGWHDNYWGNCNCPKCSAKIGVNHLGKILERVRDEILTQY